MYLVDSLGTRQTDARTAAIEVKVKKLDAELQGHKDKMAKMKAGPGKVCWVLPIRSPPLPRTTGGEYGRG